MGKEEDACVEVLEWPSLWQRTLASDLQDTEQQLAASGCVSGSPGFSKRLLSMQVQQGEVLLTPLGFLVLIHLWQNPVVF